jgi:hypothetical protein
MPAEEAPADVGRHRTASIGQHRPIAPQPQALFSAGREILDPLQTSLERSGNMPYTVYKLIHLASILFLFTIAGGVALYAANGGTREKNVAKRLVSVIHGLTLVLILVSGFGLIARLGSGFELWVWIKFAIWFAIGSIALLPLRRPHLGYPFLFLIPILGALSAFMAIFKPS